MKKLFIYMSLIAATLISCNEDLETEGISTITYFPDFILTGEDLYVVDIGEPFTDPGIVVQEKGTEIPFNFIYTGRYTGYSGSVIGTELDQYFLTYSATNSDGFTTARSRTIARIPTGDFVNSIEGAYLSSIERVDGESYSNIIVLVTQVEPGVFRVSCALGGFYADGRGIGDDFLVEGFEITINDLASNDFTYEDDVVRIADESEMVVSDVKIDTEARTISFKTTADATFTNGEWDITLTQIQP
jgi:hypothetical protein